SFNCTSDCVGVKLSFFKVPLTNSLLASSTGSPFTISLTTAIKLPAVISPTGILNSEATFGVTSKSTSAPPRYAAVSFVAIIINASEPPWSSTLKEVFPPSVLKLQGKQFHPGQGSNTCSVCISFVCVTQVQCCAVSAFELVFMFW